MSKEVLHERICTFLVAADKSGATATEIREALESSDDDAKVEAMERAISALLTGEQLPGLFMTIVRYVMPSQNHTIQKLLLLYLETMSKTDDQGKLLPEMILICQNLRNNLQHPNEYLRGVTLRFLCRVREEELLEPLVPSVLACVDHRHSYVRRSAVQALASIALLPRGDALVPDAAEVLERVLANEADASARRNALAALGRIAPERAAEHVIEAGDAVVEWPDLLQTAALELCARAARTAPDSRGAYIRVAVALLGAKAPSVVFEAANTLVSLSSAPTAVRAATGTYCKLLASQSDNNVRLVLLDRLEMLARQHRDAVREALLDVLRVLPAPDLDVRLKALRLAKDLLAANNVDAVVALLKREAARASRGSEEGADAYRSALVGALHDAAVRFPAVAPAVLHLLLDFLSDPDAAAALDVARFVRDLAQTNAALRPVISERLLEALPALRAPRVAAAAAWILTDYARGEDDALAALAAIEQALGPSPFDADAKRAEQEEEEAVAAATRAGPAARPAVLADGSYATQTALPGTPTSAGAAAAAAAAAAGLVSEHGLRAMLLAGDPFLAGSVAAALAKAVVRARRGADPRRARRAAARALDAIATVLRLAELSPAPLDNDSRDRVLDAVEVISRPDEARDAAWLEQSLAAFAALVDERARVEAARAKRDAAKAAIAPDELIDFTQLLKSGYRPQASTKDPVEADLALATGHAPAPERSPAAASAGARLSKVVQLTGFNDPIYAEAYVTVHQYDIVLDVSVTNRTPETLQGVSLELATMGDLKLVERPQSYALAPGASKTISANIKVSSTETGAIFGNLVYESATNREPSVIVLNDIHIDIMDYIVPADCSDAAFRAMWAEFEWENKVAINTAIDDLAAFVKHVVDSTNMRCLTPESALKGDAGILTANLYARSIFGEDALVNVAVEQNQDGSLGGFIRIRSKTQGIALSLGDKLILKQKG